MVHCFHTCIGTGSCLMIISSTFFSSCFCGVCSCVTTTCCWGGVSTLIFDICRPLIIASHGVGEALVEGFEVSYGGVASVGVDDDFACVVHYAPEAIELIFQIASASRLQGFHFCWHNHLAFCIRQTIASILAYLIIFSAAIHHLHSTGIAAFSLYYCRTI